MKIDPARFYRMSMCIYDMLMRQGITEVEQLAVRTPKEIKALSIPGVGKQLSKRWRETAIKLLACNYETSQTR